MTIDIEVNNNNNITDIIKDDQIYFNLKSFTIFNVEATILTVLFVLFYVYMKNLKSKYKTKPQILANSHKTTIYYYDYSSLCKYILIWSAINLTAWINTIINYYLFYTTEFTNNITNDNNNNLTYPFYLSSIFYLCGKSFAIGFFIYLAQGAFQRSHAPYSYSKLNQSIPFATSILLLIYNFTFYKYTLTNEGVQVNYEGYQFLFSASTQLERITTIIYFIPYLLFLFYCISSIKRSTFYHRKLKELHTFHYYYIFDIMIAISIWWFCTLYFMYKEALLIAGMLEVIPQAISLEVIWCLQKDYKFYLEDEKQKNKIKIIS